MSDTGSNSRTVTLVNRRGLHARASAQLARLAGTLTPTLKIAKNAEAVHATSIMGLMMLGAAYGDAITISAEGAEAAAAIEAVADLVANRFGEAE